MTSPRRLLAALLALTTPIALVAPSTVTAQDDDNLIVVTASGASLDAEECAGPIAITEIFNTAQRPALNDPRNPLGFPTIDPNTAVIRPVRVGAVTLVGDFTLPPEDPSPDSGCADFWEGADIFERGDSAYYGTSQQWTGIGASFSGTLTDLGDQAYREFTFLWDIDGVPAVDAAASGLPDTLDGAAEGAGYSNNLGEISTVLFRGNGVGADNFGNPLSTIQLMIDGEPWWFLFTPRPEPVRIGAFSADEQRADSVVVVDVAEPVAPQGPTTLGDIAAQPGFTLIGGSGDDDLSGSEPEPTTTPAPSTTSPPATTEAPATTEPPASTTPPATDAPVETETISESAEDEAEGGGGSVLPILIILVIAFGLVAVLLWLLLLRPRRPYEGGHEAEPASASPELRTPFGVSLHPTDDWQLDLAFSRSVLSTALARGARPDEDGWVQVTYGDVYNSQVDVGEFKFDTKGRGNRVARMSELRSGPAEFEPGVWDVFIHETTFEVRKTESLDSDEADPADFEPTPKPDPVLPTDPDRIPERGEVISTDDTEPGVN